jgi:hypothetical protein
VLGSYLPPGQAVHALRVPVAPAEVPARQGAQAEPEEVLYCPAAQLRKHAVCPVLGWCLPLGQAEHALRVPVAPANVFAGQGAQVPEELYCPAAQLRTAGGQGMYCACP